LDNKHRDRHIDLGSIKLEGAAVEKVMAEVYKDYATGLDVAI
jgi:hypothetical protein